MQQSKILLLADAISKPELYRSDYWRTPPAYKSISSVKGPRKPPCAVTETKKLKNGHVLDKCTLVKRDTSVIRLCRKVSHLSRFDSDSLYINFFAVYQGAENNKLTKTRKHKFHISALLLRFLRYTLLMTVPKVERATHHKYLLHESLL